MATDASSPTVEFIPDEELVPLPGDDLPAADPGSIPELKVDPLNEALQTKRDITRVERTQAPDPDSPFVAGGGRGVKLPLDVKSGNKMFQPTSGPILPGSDGAGGLPPLPAGEPVDVPTLDLPDLTVPGQQGDEPTGQLKTLAAWASILFLLLFLAEGAGLIDIF